MVPGFAYTIDMKSNAVDAFFAPGRSNRQTGRGKRRWRRRSEIAPGFTHRLSALRQGTYKICATTFDGNQTGAYTLAVRQAENVVKDLPSGKVNVVML